MSVSKLTPLLTPNIYYYLVKELTSLEQCTGMKQIEQILEIYYINTFCGDTVLNFLIFLGVIMGLLSFLAR